MREAAKVRKNIVVLSEVNDCMRKTWKVSTLYKLIFENDQYRVPQISRSSFAIHLQAQLDNRRIYLQAELDNFSWHELDPQDSPPIKTFQMDAEVDQICEEPFGQTD